MFGYFQTPLVSLSNDRQQSTLCGARRFDTRSACGPLTGCWLTGCWLIHWWLIGCWLIRCWLAGRWSIRCWSLAFACIPLPLTGRFEPLAVAGRWSQLWIERLELLHNRLVLFDHHRGELANAFIGRLLHREFPEFDFRLVPEDQDRCHLADTAFGGRTTATGPLGLPSGPLLGSPPWLRVGLGLGFGLRLGPSRLGSGLLLAPSQRSRSERK